MLLSKSARVAIDVQAKLDRLLSRAVPSMVDALGIEFVELSYERICARMPVDRRTCQPLGLLHGGASAAFAETLASVGAWLNVDEANGEVVGVEINANHLRAVRDGVVIGSAEPLHRGRSTQVWDVRISDEKENLVCVARCTLAVVSRKDVDV